MRLYIVRHGEPEGSKSGKRYLGRTDIPLSDTGRLQAEELGEWLAAQTAGRIVRIVSSPLRRSFDSAQIIREYLGCGPVETDPDLCEIDMGIWDGRSFDEIRIAYPEEYAARGYDLWNYKVTAGESFAETGERFRSAVGRACSGAGPEDVMIIVTHAGAMCAGLSLMTGTSFEDWMKRKIPYAGAIVMDLA